MQQNEMEAAEAGPLSTGAAQALPACDICDKVFKSATDVKKHRIVHFEGKYVCSTCGKKFKTPGNRNVHERQVHSVPKYDCKYCDKKYKSDKTLKSHILKMHAAEDDTLERQQEEDPDLTLEAPEGEGGEEMEVHLEPGEVREVTLDVIPNPSEYAVQEAEEVLVLPDMDAEASAATSDTSNLETVFNSCFQRDRITSDKNNNSDCSISIYIGDEILKVSGKEELVLTAGTLLHDYFFPEEREDELGEAAPPVETEDSNNTVSAPPGLSLTADETEEMETDNSGLASDGIGDTEAPRAGYREAQEAAMPASAMGGIAGSEEVEETETVTEVQESVLPAPDEVAVDDADNEAGEAENIITEASSSTTSESGRAEKRFKCTVCEKTFRTKQYYREHLKVHMFGPNYKCDICKKSFSHKCILQKHEQEKHAPDEEKILCPQCGKQFRSQTTLKRHMVLHDKKEYSKELKQEALQLSEKHGKAEAARRLQIPYRNILFTIIRSIF